jgi:serine/threonine protein kinase
MDGAMYPDAWHPIRDDYKRDNIRQRIEPYTRTQRPPRYYFIDFGISRLYSAEDGPHPLEPPIRGGDKSVPEFQQSMKPCDPFPTDIYYVGNVIREEMLNVRHPLFSIPSAISSSFNIQKYRGFPFMRQLVSDMVQDDPAKRPTIHQVVERFEKICGKLRPFRLASRSGPREEWFGHLRDLSSRVILAIKGVLAVPPAS